MKIYTKTGDKGITGLIGGTRVPKYHLRIEAYGTVDELNSFIGLLRDQDVSSDQRLVLLEIQDRLFTMGSHLASDPEKGRMKLPELKEEDIIFLEKEIDKMDGELEPMKHFILPGGHRAVSTAHICRCVCRRAERLIIHLAEETKVEEVIIRYMNRLSDYLFTLARKLGKDHKITEAPWTPRV